MPPPDPQVQSSWYDLANSRLTVVLNIPGVSIDQYVLWYAYGSFYSGYINVSSWTDNVGAGTRTIVFNSITIPEAFFGSVTIGIHAFAGGELGGVTAVPFSTTPPAPAPAPAPPPPSGVPCFLGNAPVATPSGYRLISELCVGDEVLTPDGDTARILEVSVTPNVTPCTRNNPYIVRKGMFKATEDVYISPRHRIMLPGVGLIQARKLGLDQVEMSEPFTYYNLKLEGAKHMLVANMHVESIPDARSLIRIDFAVGPMSIPVA